MPAQPSKPQPDPEPLHRTVRLGWPLRILIGLFAVGTLSWVVAFAGMAQRQMERERVVKRAEKLEHMIDWALEHERPQEALASLGELEALALDRPGLGERKIRVAREGCRLLDAGCP